MNCNIEQLFTLNRLNEYLLYEQRTRACNLHNTRDFYAVMHTSSWRLRRLAYSSGSDINIKITSGYFEVFVKVPFTMTCLVVHKERFLCENTRFIVIDEKMERELQMKKLLIWIIQFTKLYWSVEAIKKSR